MKTIVSRRIVNNTPSKMARVFTLKEFYDAHNKILIIRSVGGLGDILMHRMMFEDFKRVMPEAQIHFACPTTYHDALTDHPFIDQILDSEKIDKHDYVISYNTTTACGRYEMKMAPHSGLHRADIWATHCGISLQKHEMHISLTDEEKAWGRAKIAEVRDREGPVVMVCPISAMENKNLLPHQQLGLVKGLHDRGCCAIGLHSFPILPFDQNDIPYICKVTIRQWMSLIYNADYTISVDTAAFHCAGGMKRPVLGIFTFADGKVYSKYYDAELVQRHRDDDPTWTCGPCYNWHHCSKTKSNPKPCLTEITPEMILQGVDKMLSRWPINKG